MGTGNVIPLGCLDYEMVYVDPGNDTNYEPSEYEFWLGELEQDVTRLLPESFQAVNAWKGSNFVLAESKLLQIVRLDNQWSIAIAIIVPEPDGENQRIPLARRHMSLLAKRLFNALSDQYELRVRSGPWTSGLYQKR